MSAYPNLFEVLDDNGDAIAQEIDRKSKVIIKDAPATKKKEAPKKEDKKSEPVEQAADGFELINRPPRQPKAEKASPVTQSSGRGGRGRGRGDRPPRAEGDQPRRQDGDRPPRSDRPRTDRPPRQEGEGGERPPRRERAPRQEGEGGERAPRQEGERAPRRPYQPRQDGDQPRAPRENRPPRENNGDENPRPYRERRDFNENRGANDESSERRDERPRGRGGRGRGRGNYGNRAAEGAPHNDLAEGAPVETEEPQRYHSHSRRHEDKLTDEKGFVQAKHRAFDRRSATGRTGDDVKRSGRGPNNWGAAGEENNEAYAEAVAFETAVDNNEAAPAEGETLQGNAAELAKEKPEEDKTRTLKEYRESLATELAQVELPAPRQASTEKWNNNKILRKDANNIKLSVIAPTKEKKKGETTTTVKPKAKKEVVVDLLKFKAAPREGQERRRDFQNERPQNDRPRRDNKSQQNRKEKAAPAVSAPAPAAAKIDKNSKEDFPALVAVKN